MIEVYVCHKRRLPHIPVPLQQHKRNISFTQEKWPNYLEFTDKIVIFAPLK